MDRVSLQSKVQCKSPLRKRWLAGARNDSKKSDAVFSKPQDSVARSKRPDVAATPECCGPSRCAAAEPNFQYGQSSIGKVRTNKLGDSGRVKKSDRILGRSTKTYENWPRPDRREPGPKRRKLRGSGKSVI